MKYSLSLAGILLCGSLAVQAQPADRVLGTQPAQSAAASDGVVTTSGGGSSPADVVVTATAPTPEQVQAITQAFQQRFPGIQVDAIRLTPMGGLYEVQVGMDLVYTDAQVDYVLQGSLIDAKARRDLTAERLEALQQFAFASLPLDRAIRQVKGAGERQVAVFEDPNCGYCKQLHRTLEDVENVTVYTFLFPILSPDSTTRSRNIWCAADPAKAWKDWMLNGVQPVAADCPTPIQENLALGRKLNVQGTPALFFADGSRVNGALSLTALKQKLDAQSSAQ